MTTEDILKQIILDIKKNDVDGNFGEFEIIEGDFFHGTSVFKLDKIMSNNLLLGTPINEDIAGSMGDINENGIVFCCETQEEALNYGDKIIKIFGVKALRTTHTAYDQIEILVPAQFLEKYENWNFLGDY